MFMWLTVFCTRCASCALDAQYLRKEIPRAIYGQDCTSLPNAQYMRKYIAQDCTSFPNANYMCKICARLYFPKCAIYAQDLKMDERKFRRIKQNCTKDSFFGVHNFYGFISLDPILCVTYLFGIIKNAGAEPPDIYMSENTDPGPLINLS